MNTSDLATNSSSFTIPILTTPNEREEKEGETGDRSSSPTSTNSGRKSPVAPLKLPHIVKISNAHGIQIGPTYNCVDPSTVRTPPPGSNIPPMPLPPARHHVEALLRNNREVDTSIMDVVSTHLGNYWRHLGRQMDYTTGQLDGIDTENPRLSDKAYALMEMWRDRESSGATVANLTRLLMKVKAFEPVIHLPPL